MGLLLLLDLVAITAIAWILTASLIRLAPRLGLVDLPSERKVHLQPIPKGGGLAIFLAVILPLGVNAWLRSVNPGESSSGYARLGLASAITLLGLVDDFHPLPWQFRLCVQFGVAAAAVTGCLPAMRVEMQIIGIIWLVAIINAFNMLDNMDALSGGVALIACGFLCCSVAPSDAMFGLPRNTGPYWCLLGALAGFLWFNWPPARIFMGDAGSTFLGYMIGVGALEVAHSAEGPDWRWLVALCICAVPIYDQLTVVLVRSSQGRSPFHADQQHLSHRLVARGLSSRAAVRVIHALALASGSAGLALYYIQTWSEAVAVVGLVLVGFAVLAVVELVPFVRGKEGSVGDG